MLTISDQFPLFKEYSADKVLTYLDSAATAQKPLSVIQAEEQYYRQSNANPNRGIYELDLRATEIHETARQKVANFIGAEFPEEIIFTQNTTEAFNLLAYSYGMPFLKEGNTILITVMEHHSNLIPWQRVAKATGAKLVYLYPDENGHFSDEELQSKICDGVKLVSVHHVSNVMGTLSPIAKITELAHQIGAVVALDSAQSIPHMPINVKELDVDFIAFSGHKMYGPMGIGVLYGKKELLEKMPPFMSGGDMIDFVSEQESTYAPLPRKFESGTRNVGAAAGLSAAIDYMQDLGYDKITAHEEELMVYAMNRLTKLPFITIYGTKNPKERFGVISFNVNEVHPHDTATILGNDEVAIRAGHHCAQPLMRFLHLTACCRLSFGVYNTTKDIDTLVESLKTVRRIMGFES
ncbi:cysteine desulfurase [Scatolibacter rhodanostii]|uniref:cysteine desulfurase n=1 Tax=Scatolibacter rhodanostii TaxID=2014781 RepID=UPI000C08342E|nr:cysteine desulfurase [Scatolibacter rhodanostii]